MPARLLSPNLPPALRQRKRSHSVGDGQALRRERSFTSARRRVRVRRAGSADWLGVYAPTVTATLQRLARGRVRRIGADRSVTLTPNGEDLAAKIVRVHRCPLERWLTDVLGLDWATADGRRRSAWPRRLERVADRLDETLGHPTTCPHGNVVPGREAPYGRKISSRSRTCNPACRRG